MSAWQFDRDTGEHFLQIDEDRSHKVYKTAAGDYAHTIHSEADGFGGDVEYFETLKRAKAHAEGRKRTHPSATTLRKWLAQVKSAYWEALRADRSFSIIIHRR